MLSDKMTQWGAQNMLIQDEGEKGEAKMKAGLKNVRMQISIILKYHLNPVI